MQKLYRLHCNNKYALLHTEVFICVVCSLYKNSKLCFENVKLSHIPVHKVHFLSALIYFLTCICRLGQLTVQNP